jgi:hypothetical protein
LLDADDSSVSSAGSDGSGLPTLSFAIVCTGCAYALRLADGRWAARKADRVPVIAFARSAQHGRCSEHDAGFARSCMFFFGQCETVWGVRCLLFTLNCHPIPSYNVDLALVAHVPLSLKP